MKKFKTCLFDNYKTTHSEHDYLNNNNNNKTLFIFSHMYKQKLVYICREFTHHVNIIHAHDNN